MKYRYLPLLISVLFLLSSCRSAKLSQQSAATAPVVIYKTKQKYQKQVWVKLSGDGKKIQAYPAPSDVVKQRPVELAEGYWLKKMPGNAVLSLTIDEYADSDKDYTPDKLQNMILDSDPYLEIYDCSSCTTGDTISINELIRAGQLGKCKVLR